MHIADQTWHFAQFYDNQDLALSIGKASDLILLLQLHTPQQQRVAYAQIEGACFVVFFFCDDFCIHLHICTLFNKHFAI